MLKGRVIFLDFPWTRSYIIACSIQKALVLSKVVSSHKVSFNMEGYIKGECKGNPEKNVLELKNINLGGKVLIVNPNTKQYFKILIGDREGWVPKHCVEMAPCDGYTGDKNTEEVLQDNKCVLAFSNEVNNFVVSLKSDKKVKKLYIVRMKKGNIFTVAGHWKHSVNELVDELNRTQEKVLQRNSSLPTSTKYPKRVESEGSTESIKDGGTVSDSSLPTPTKYHKRVATTQAFDEDSDGKLINRTFKTKEKHNKINESNVCGKIPSIYRKRAATTQSSEVHKKVKRVGKTKTKQSKGFVDQSSDEDPDGKVLKETSDEVTTSDKLEDGSNEYGEMTLNSVAQLRKLTKKLIDSEPFEEEMLDCIQKLSMEYVNIQSLQISQAAKIVRSYRDWPNEVGVNCEELYQKWKKRVDFLSKHQ